MTSHLMGILTRSFQAYLWKELIPFSHGLISVMMEKSVQNHVKTIEIR